MWNSGKLRAPRQQTVSRAGNQDESAKDGTRTGVSAKRHKWTKADRHRTSGRIRKTRRICQTVHKSRSIIKTTHGDVGGPGTNQDDQMEPPPFVLPPRESQDNGQAKFGAPPSPNLEPQKCERPLACLHAKSLS